MFERIKSYIFNDAETSEASKDAIAARFLGERLPVSIATAMIVEGEKATPAKWCKQVLINLSTLARNIINSAPPERRELILVDDLIDEIIREMQILKQMLPEVKAGTVVDFYFPDYSTITKGFPKGNIRIPKTSRQEWERLLMMKLFKRMKKRKEDGELDYRISDWKLERDERETTLLTHNPTDLLSQYQFPKLNLVESHTGVVKARRQWYTKLNKNQGEDLSFIPFCKFSIQVFGDGVWFNVSNTKVKSMVKTMAIRDDWNSMTTESKIRGSIGKVKHPADRDILLSYL